MTDWMTNCRKDQQQTTIYSPKHCSYNNTNTHTHGYMFYVVGFSVATTIIKGNASGWVLPSHDMSTAIIATTPTIFYIHTYLCMTWQCNFFLGSLKKLQGVYFLVFCFSAVVVVYLSIHYLRRESSFFHCSWSFFFYSFLWCFHSWMSSSFANEWCVFS